MWPKRVKKIISSIFLFMVVVSVFTVSLTRLTQTSPVYAVTGDIQVSATVPPLVSQFDLVLESSSSTSPLVQNTTIPFTVTYGSHSTANLPMAIQVSWNKGVLDTDTQTQVDIVEYSEGTAGQAYGDTSPVIDLVNKTITWNIASFPAGLSNQQLTFGMHTNTAYTGTQKVKFAVNGQFIQPAVGGKTTIYRSYTYVPPIQTATPTPSPSPSPVATPTLVATPSAATTPPPQPFPFSSLNLSNISDTKMNLFVSASRPFMAKLAYGTAPTSLTNKIIAGTPDTSQAFLLTGFTPQTRYYFKF